MGRLLSLAHKRSMNAVGHCRACNKPAETSPLTLQCGAEEKTVHLCAKHHDHAVARIQNHIANGDKLFEMLAEGR